MSDDSETVENTEKGSLAEVTDDSCTVEFIEIVPLDRASDDDHLLEVIDPIAVISPEDLQELKQEMPDENVDEVPYYSVKQEPANETSHFLQRVSSACTDSTEIISKPFSLVSIKIHDAQAH